MDTFLQARNSMMPDQPNVDVFSADRPLEQNLRSILKGLNRKDFLGVA